MYYEEKVINGVLCYRTTPNGEFIEKTKEQLTIMIGRLNDRLDNLGSSNMALFQL